MGKDQNQGRPSAKETVGCWQQQQQQIAGFWSRNQQQGETEQGCTLQQGRVGVGARWRSSMPTRVLRWFAACQGRGPGSSLFWSTTQLFGSFLLLLENSRQLATLTKNYAEDEIALLPILFVPN